jgi:hypothetical protein
LQLLIFVSNRPTKKKKTSRKETTTTTLCLVTPPKTNRKRPSVQKKKTRPEVGAGAGRQYQVASNKMRNVKLPVLDNTT